MENKYRIVISNASKTVEIESSDVTWLEKKQKELMKFLSTEHTTEKSEMVTTKSSVQESKKIPAHITINEFYRKYCNDIKTNTDLSVYFLYYLNLIEKKKDINTNNIRELFIKVGIPKANTLNYADILGRAKKRALVNYINSYWSLTITGEDFVLNKIQSS
jgi:hypothetical protein